MKIKDKVKILSKTAIGYEQSQDWLDNKYPKRRGYVVAIKEEKNFITVGRIPSINSGNYFRKSDLKVINKNQSSKPKSRFKVGDKITGLDKIPYGITTKDAIMKIVRILPDNEIKVKIIQHKSKYASQIGKIFQVDVKHFKKVKEPLMKFKTFKTMNTKNPIYWECIKGKHKKFWAAKIIIEADVPTSTSGKSVTQKYVLFRKWGRIGNASQTMKNEFDDLYTAEQELEKLIRDKEYKGYKPIF